MLDYKLDSSCPAGLYQPGWINNHVRQTGRFASTAVDPARLQSCACYLFALGSAVKTIDDAVMAVFANPAAAIEAVTKPLCKSEQQCQQTNVSNIAFLMGFMVDQEGSFRCIVSDDVL